MAKPGGSLISWIGRRDPPPCRCAGAAPLSPGAQDRVNITARTVQIRAGADIRGPPFLSSRGSLTRARSVSGVQSSPQPVSASYSEGSMTLTPELVADILVRQKYITPEQGDLIKQEAKLLPQRVRTGSAYEQKSLAYEVVLRLKLPNGRDSGG